MANERSAHSRPEDSARPSGKTMNTGPASSRRRWPTAEEFRQAFDEAESLQERQDRRRQEMRRRRVAGREIRING